MHVKLTWTMPDSCFRSIAESTPSPIHVGDDKADDGVPTGKTHIYTYHVPERAGPGPAEPSSKMWMCAP
jgi:hypothetical protein